MFGHAKLFWTKQYIHHIFHSNILYLKVVFNNAVMESNKWSEIIHYRCVKFKLKHNYIVNFKFEKSVFMEQNFPCGMLETFFAIFNL